MEVVGWWVVLGGWREERCPNKADEDACHSESVLLDWSVGCTCRWYPKMCVRSCLLSQVLQHVLLCAHVHTSVLFVSYMRSCVFSRASTRSVE